MWTKPTLTRKITFNQFNSILLYTALGRVEVMKKFYQHSIKLTIPILHNLILNVICVGKTNVNCFWLKFHIGNQFWSEEDVGDLEDAWSGRLGCGRMCISRDTDPPDVLTRLRLPSESLSGATGGHFVARIKTGFRPMGQSRLVMIAT